MKQRFCYKRSLLHRSKDQPCGCQSHNYLNSFLARYRRKTLRLRNCILAGKFYIAVIVSSSRIMSTLQLPTSTRHHNFNFRLLRQQILLKLYLAIFNLVTKKCCHLLILGEITYLLIIINKRCLVDTSTNQLTDQLTNMLLLFSE